jgi:sulfite exporter TauE/SafE
MRFKGLVQAIVAAVVAGLFYWWQHVIVATIVAGIGTLVLLLAVTSPLGAFAAIERAMARFGQWVGVVVGWLVLLPLFYLFFFPFGSLFRRGENDRLKRFYQTASDTYWVDRVAADDPVASRQRPF